MEGPYRDKVYCTVESLSAQAWQAPFNSKSIGKLTYPERKIYTWKAYARALPFRALEHVRFLLRRFIQRTQKPCVARIPRLWWPTKCLKDLTLQNLIWFGTGHWTQPVKGEENWVCDEFEVLTMVPMKRLWGVMLCSLIQIYKHFHFHTAKEWGAVPTDTSIPTDIM